MPLFIDRHEDPNLTPEIVAEAHAADVAIQEKHGVKYHTYWFDPNDGTVFCDAEGPSREAVETVHREAHGAMASTIVELDEFQALNSFMGGFPKHPVGTAYAEPAMRAIVFTDICGSVAQTHQLGDAGHMAVLNDHNTIVRRALQEYEGREVKHTGDGIMAAFSSVAAATSFAIVVQRELHQRNQTAEHPLHVSIGISAGEPLTDENNDLFGAAVQLAARLCGDTAPGEIAVSLAVRELCIGKPFTFVDRGPRELKGLPEPTQVYVVQWSED
jgi:class 3 adenylate cyclase